MSASVPSCQVLAIGLGPANLALGALAAPVADLQVRFLEARDGIRWHEGLMLAGSELQVSFLKDLTTMVDPTSPFTFLNYLAVHGNLYRFLIACDRGQAFRDDFARYYQWAASHLPDVAWNARVEDVRLVGGRLAVTTDKGATYRTDNLVLGTGRRPYLPPFADRPGLSGVIHASRYDVARDRIAGRDVLVVGGGQSGAEVVRDLIDREGNLPRSLTWVTSRLNFLPLDDSPFTNEWFHPAWVDHFGALPAARRASLLEHQRLASDGISGDILREIYRRLYHLDTMRPGLLRARLVVSSRVTSLEPLAHHRHRCVLEGIDDGATSTVDADVVVFATGYRRAEPPDYLAGIAPLLSGWELDSDYALRWDGPAAVRIFAQNAGDDSHGIADRNLSLNAWRAARIVNAICGRTVYRTGPDNSAVSWSPAALAPWGHRQGPPPTDDVPGAPDEGRMHYAGRAAAADVPRRADGGDDLRTGLVQPGATGARG
ncbi:lysine N6-hydroxylase [Parafrankia irregularis]|uniref:L-lysine N6-monooxygenase MbtG n=1 Tax=Parafrankia irregularis TaxID=795642 RepID=A0A0S4QVN7_9ACTN|nr:MULTISPECIES: SidA/IucD/PvdA family monooxygenase [Parafrankia]MBE3205811.1 SidA/IucD/PvdA family monooxygenase [Parafrankia sp. CH37]CUU59685.1 lysine N6-hydroxylase [Parafrankia irregularis]